MKFRNKKYKTYRGGTHVSELDQLLQQYPEHYKFYIQNIVEDFRQQDTNKTGSISRQQMINILMDQYKYQGISDQQAETQADHNSETVFSQLFGSNKQTHPQDDRRITLSQLVKYLIDVSQQQGSHDPDDYPDDDDDDDYPDDDPDDDDDDDYPDDDDDDDDDGDDATQLRFSVDEEDYSKKEYLDDKQLLQTQYPDETQLIDKMCIAFRQQACRCRKTLHYQEVCRMLTKNYIEKTGHTHSKAKDMAKATVKAMFAQYDISPGSEGISLPEFIDYFVS